MYHHIRNNINTNNTKSNIDAETCIVHLLIDYKFLITLFSKLNLVNIQLFNISLDVLVVIKKLIT